MDAQTFLANFGTIAVAPGGVEQLREMVLELAVAGCLVEQDPQEESSTEALNRIRAVRGPTIKAKVKGRPVVPRIPEAWERSRTIPANWEWARLDDTGEYINGLAFKQSEWTDNGHPIIRIQNLTDPDAPFNYATGPFPEDRLVKNGDMLVSWSATLEAFVWNRGGAVVNQHIFKVIPDTTLVYPGFLYHLLRHVIRSLAASDAAHGLAMKHINRGPFVSHPVPIPPLAEQERIAAKVDEFLQLCDELETRQQAEAAVATRFRASALDVLVNAETDTDLATAWNRVQDSWNVLTNQSDDVEDVRQAIFQLAIEGKLASTEGHTDHGVALQDDLHGDGDYPRRDAGPDADEAQRPEGEWAPFSLPDGWKWRRLGDLVDPERGVSYGVIKLGREPSNGGVPTIRCSDVRRLRIDETNIRTVDPAVSADYLRTVLRGGELLVNIRGTLGGCAVVPAHMAGYNVAREVAVVPVIHADPRYILLVMASPLFTEFTKNSLRGIAYRGLNLGLLRNFLVPIPPEAEQGRIARTVDELLSACGDLEVALRHREATAERLAASAAHRFLRDIRPGHVSISIGTPI